MQRDAEARTLERITVTGYKSIQELRSEGSQGFKLRNLNVLIGANGAGKSNFLSLFKLLESIANERLQLFVGVNGGADFLLHFGQKKTKELKIKLELGSAIELFDYEVTLGPAIPNRLIFLNERGTNRLRGESNGQSLEWGSGQAESGLHRKDIWWEVVIIERLKDWKVYHFQDTTPEAKVKQNPDIHDNHQLKSDGGNLASILYLLKNHYQPFYNRILSTVKLAAPFVDDFILQPMLENAQRIRLKWRHKASENDFDISQLSDGTLRFICLTTLLLQPNPPSLIIIDEPELGLHPYAITVLAGMLRSVSTQTQIIISTQSISLVNEFQPEDIIVVDREDDASTFKRLNSEELAIWLEDYSLGELWEKNLVGGRPR